MGHSCCAAETFTHSATCAEDWDSTVLVQFLGAVVMPVVVQRQAPGCSQCRRFESPTVSLLWRNGGNGGWKAVCSCFQAGESELITQVMCSISIRDCLACTVMVSWTYTHLSLTPYNNNCNNDNNDTICGGSVLTGEEPPPHFGELKHALPQAGGPTQSQLSRPMSSGHHISMEHRLRRKQLNSETNASNKKYLKEIQEKRK